MKAINECDTAVGYVQIRQCSSLTCEIVCVCVHMRERHRVSVNDSLPKVSMPAGSNLLGCPQESAQAPG